MAAARVGGGWEGKAWAGLSLFLAGGDCRSCLPVGYYGFNHYSGAISRAAAFSPDSAAEKPLSQAEGIFIASAEAESGRGGEWTGLAENGARGEAFSRRRDPRRAEHREEEAGKGKEPRGGRGGEAAAVEPERRRWGLKEGEQ